MPTQREVGRAGTPAQGRELRARGKRTMRKLLDAGVRVFATKGYHAARVDDIVKVAKTSHGTFYLYFSSKEDLFQALVLDVADQLTSLTDELEVITPDDAGRAALRGWLDRFSAMYEQYGAVVQSWTEAEIDSTEFGRIGEDVMGRIAAALARQVADGAPDDIDVDVATLAFVAMIDRFHYFFVSNQLDTDRDTMLDTLAAVTHAGLFGIAD